MDFKKEYIELLVATHTKEELAQLFVEAKEIAAAPRVFDWNVVENPSPLLYQITYDSYHPQDREYGIVEGVLSEPLKDYLKELGFVLIND